MSQTPWLRQTCDEEVGAYLVRHTVELRSDWTVLFGPSGAGKSTWLRMLAGLLPQSTGSLWVRGEELRAAPAHRRGIALVEQSPALFPHLNVEKNVRFGQRSGNYGHAKEKDLTAELLSDFRLTALKDAATIAISGGERQRVAIARALGSNPRVLLLDEVFTGMDASLRTELIAVLQRWQMRMGLPILSVTHDVAEALATGDEVLRMREGQIVASGPPEQVLHVERAALLEMLRVPEAG